MTQAGSGASAQPDEPAGTRPVRDDAAPARDDAGPARDDETADVPGRPGPVAGFRTGLVVAVVFVLGLALGAVAVGLLGDTTPPAVSDQAGEGPSDGGLVIGDLDPDDGPFQVNGACLGAVNALQDGYATMDELGRAATALDAAQLDEVVRRLQPLQRQLEADVAACRVREIDDPPGGTSAPGGTATPRSSAPTSSPTD
ncbi:hypothetical protein [Blastococcus tunisiensis]|uniref:Uncharacterized protein n=1 Tax=Blastococcus tunisiensis TaxID=1798228 RepID=A0A1I2J1C9_9ACTN|nr:hypothetical protein [Blastococcus sp. DSM 46838]SFF47810.1 hypothetical protein SAMN05216574_114147 [Blastococcus sp. DSM 46838]